MVALGLTVCAAPALAGPDSEIASAFDEGDPFDLHLTLDYDFALHRAAIERERAGFPGTDPDGPMPVTRDLRFSSSRHTLTPRLSAGIGPDLSLSLALPIVITDSRTLSFDQQQKPCTFGNGPDKPECIDATNSSTVLDGLLQPTGWDALDPTGPGFTDTADPMIFRGPDRHGVDQLQLGIAWAPMDQAKDDTKPTWRLQAELWLPIGAPMKLDRDNPDSETSVGRGEYEVHLATSIARRIGWAEPYVELWWTAPFAYTDDSPFQDPGFGTERWQAQQSGGTHFGFEAIAFEKPEDHQRVSLDLSGRVEAMFEGRNYSELWEVLAYSGSTADAGNKLILDSDPTTAGVQGLSYPGVSNIENYMKLGGKVAIRGELGEMVRIAASFDFTTAQEHLVTFADAGVDLPTCKDGQTRGCEVESNDEVTPRTSEVNPLYVPLVDLVGHRYRVTESFDYVAGVELRVLF
jgi:hypothetical protein